MTQTASKTLCTVYAPDGKPHEVNRLNALDLTRFSGYTWAAQAEETGHDECDVVVTDEVQDIEVEAKTLADYDSVEAYLNTFEAPALRTMLAERFNEKTSHRTGKAKLIRRYMELDSEQAV